MKRIILMFLCFVCVTGMWAQKRVGQLSFIPRVGLNLSNLGDMDIYTAIDFNKEDILKAKSRPDFMLGADVEYQLMAPLGISVGAYYSRQGCRWADFSIESIDDDKTHLTESTLDHSMVFQYINVPVSAKLYLNDFLAIHAGVQVGITLDGKYKCVNTVLTEPAKGHKVFTSVAQSDKMQQMNPLVWSIPVGISMEYDHVILDARYNIPLSRFSNLKNPLDGSYIYKGGNRVWTISVGYRF